MLYPFIIGADFMRGQVGVNGRPSLQRLLIERQIVEIATETVGTDCPEHFHFACLLKVDPAQSIDAGFYPVTMLNDMPRTD